MGKIYFDATLGKVRIGNNGEGKGKSVGEGRGEGWGCGRVRGIGRQGEYEKEEKESQVVSVKKKFDRVISKVQLRVLVS